MAFYSTPIPEVGKEIFANHENVLFGLELFYDRDLREHELIITAYVYEPGTKAPDKPDKKHKFEAEASFDYVDIIKGYDDESCVFSEDLMKEIRKELNANLGPKGVQLDKKTIYAIKHRLREYIPRKKEPGGGIG